MLFNAKKLLAKIKRYSRRIYGFSISYKSIFEFITPIKYILVQAFIYILTNNNAAVICLFVFDRLNKRLFFFPFASI